MPNDHTQGAVTGSLDQQLQALREDVASLAESLKRLASATASDATRHMHEQADDLLKRTKDAAGDATRYATGAAASIEEHIVQKPVQSALIALLIGIVIGSLGRR